MPFLENSFERLKSHCLLTCSLSPGNEIESESTTEMQPCIWLEEGGEGRGVTVSEASLTPRWCTAEKKRQDIRCRRSRLIDTHFPRHTVYAATWQATSNATHNGFSIRLNPIKDGGMRGWRREGGRRKTCVVCFVTRRYRFPTCRRKP